MVAGPTVEVAFAGAYWAIEAATFAAQAVASAAFVAAAEGPSPDAIASTLATASVSVGWRAAIAARPSSAGARQAFIAVAATAELGQAAGTSVVATN